MTSCRMVEALMIPLRLSPYLAETEAVCQVLSRQTGCWAVKKLPLQQGALASGGGTLCNLENACPLHASVNSL